MNKKNLVIAVFAAAVVFTSCSKKEADRKTVGTAKTELHVQIGPSPETIDPALSSAVDSGNMILHAFEGLVKFDRNNNVVPALAESWEKSDDGLTWTFHLRKNLKWSDGSPLTSKDFAYAWRRIADPATAAPYGYDLLSVVKGYPEAAKGDVSKLGVETPNANTFVVHLSTPCIYFDKITTFPVLVPVQEKTIKAANDKWTIDPKTYISSGPYYMTEFTDGSQIVFEKNPYYWDVENVTFDKIVWHLIEDPNTSYTAYNEGNIQLIKDVPTEEIPSLRGSSEFHVEPIMGTYYLSFNIRKELFKDSRVREALSLSIDRNYVANTIMGGTYSPAKNFVGPGMTDAALNSSFEKVTAEKYGNHFSDDYNADLAKAKKLLADAGYPDGKGFPTIEYLTNDASYHKAVAEYLQSAWKELGITMNVNIQEWKTFTADRRSGNFDIARNGWVCDWDDPSNIINLFETANGNNDGKYSSEGFDELVDRARNTNNVEKHYDLLHKAEQVALSDAAMAPIAYYNDFWLQKTNLKGTWHSPYGFWFLMYGSLE
ncbi:peptide ABC transporter substrate-binding protein [Treponema sp. Marseille-Q3903]|uniref:peptide ABC transporter substrate-binding protein n=1 Tax=Treponema sp. Marseille-Q3903 TaxID=2766703 RepID=UPI0016520EF6|nr:peptide ABC transporter substrate-binding protein [Treponema sp. Marseille-Q3903]MBC6712517.1 peptide ABC transporter substrate-binding protein [Treponema sp. Marseille-Q3903]